MKNRVLRQNMLNASVLALSCAALGVPAIASAQEPELANDEIIVTAQRRAENIQDVPISIVAASAEQLQDAGATRLMDISAIASGVAMPDGNAYVFPNIRGIGSFIQGSASNSSVAVYVDGVYVPRMTSTALELDNIASVEILRGPQATLYGRNATGGAINVITRTTNPGDPFSGRVALTAGEYNQRRATFFVESGLGDMWAFNASGYWVNRDGFIENLAPTNLDAHDLDLDSLNEYAGSARLTFTPGPRTEISLALRASEYDDTASSGGRQLNPIGADAVLDSLLGPGDYTFATEPYTTYGWANRRRGHDYNATLTGEYTGDDYTFTSISGYSQTDVHVSTDALSAAFPPGVGFNGVQPTWNFSQEFRVLSTFDGALNWMAGVNYFVEETDPTTSTESLFFGGVISAETAKSTNTATAMFGELYYDVTERLRLTAGLRYTQETFEATAVQSTQVPAGTFSSVDDNALTYRFVADYDTDWGMIYGSVSSGYKSGGINPTNLAGAPFEPEELTAYEIGAKTDLFGRRLRLNGSAFYYDFTSIQAQLVGGVGGAAQFFVNGDGATVSGIEVEFDSRITEALSVWGGVTYLIDREYDVFDIPANIPAGTPALNVSGNELVGAPETSAVLGARYDVPLSRGGELSFNGNLSYHSGYFLTVENNLGTGGLNSADAVTLLNGRIEYTSPSGWGLALWGRNLTEEEYIRAGLSAFGGATVLGSDGQPREIGVTATFEF